MRLGTYEECIGSSLRVSGACQDGVRKFTKRRPRLIEKLSGVAEKLAGSGCSKGAAAIEGRRVVECTVIAEEGSSGVERETATGNLCNEGSLLVVNKEDGSERSLLATLVWQEIATGCDHFIAGRDQGRWQQKITIGSICAARERYW
ncbi:hypothetical protein B296_00021313 [Ensete ventricosum]|uniref:Uncharacterized protein n=1 Tax=Ensete ventricosum TaxID=4639 RepID=A0A426ZKY7_ENSVE|nr:hypothetical protein B296_00021313 [Ensete ventricosum]